MSAQANITPRVHYRCGAARAGKLRTFSRKVAGSAIIAAVVCLAWARPLHAATAPLQRGEPVASGTVAASVVTLCGLAVMLVVQPHNAKATLYAGEAMNTKLAELGLDGDSASSYELADLYDPVSASCEGIRSEHERLIRTQRLND